MRVLLYYEGFYDASGGIHTHIRNLLENLHCRFLVASDDLGAQLNGRTDRDLPAIVRIGPENTSNRFDPCVLNEPVFFPYRLFTDVMRYRRTARFLRQVSFDLVHFHGTGIGSALMKSVLSLSFDSLIKPLPQNLPGETPTLGTVHGLDHGSNRAAMKLQARYLRSFQALMCVDRYMVPKVREIISPSSAPIEYVPNSVDTQQFSPAPFGLGDALRVGFVGRLERSRGLTHLHELIQNLPKRVVLRLALSASNREFRRFSGLLQRPRIKVYLNLPLARMPEFYSNIDILLNPVLVPGISRATLESLAAGRPVVMLENDARYPVEHGVSGFLLDVSKDRPSHLMRNLVHERDTLYEMGLRGREKVKREFSNQVWMPRILEIYRRVSET